MQRHIDYFEGPEGNKLIATSFEFLKKVVDKLNSFTYNIIDIKKSNLLCECRH